MKKLFLKVLLGLLFFIGGQWLGIEFKRREVAQENTKSDASAGEAHRPDGTR